MAYENLSTTLGKYENREAVNSQQKTVNSQRKAVFFFGRFSSQLAIIDNSLAYMRFNALESKEFTAAFLGSLKFLSTIIFATLFATSVLEHVQKHTCMCELQP